MNKYNDRNNMRQEQSDHLLNEEEMLYQMDHASPKKRRRHYPGQYPRPPYHNNSNYQRPDVYYIPPEVISDYIGEVVSTYIPGYGRQNVYVRGMAPNGMVSVVILQNRPGDCIQVHHSDFVGIAKPNFRCQ